MSWGKRRGLSLGDLLRPSLEPGPVLRSQPSGVCPPWQSWPGVSQEPRAGPAPAPPSSVREAENWATRDSFPGISQDPRPLIPSPLRCKFSQRPGEAGTHGSLSFFTSVGSYGQLTSSKTQRKGRRRELGQTAGSKTCFCRGGRKGAKRVDELCSQDSFKTMSRAGFATRASSFARPIRTGRQWHEAGQESEPSCATDWPQDPGQSVTCKRGADRPLPGSLRTRWSPGTRRGSAPCPAARMRSRC